VHLQVCPHCRERRQLYPSAAEIFKVLAPVTFEPDLPAEIWAEVTAAIAAEVSVPATDWLQANL
jgi:hypothetical protein